VTTPPLVEETLAARWRRRSLTVPGVVLLACLYLALSPLIVAAAAVRDLRFGRRLPTLRLALFGVVYFVCETLGLLASGALWVACGGGRAVSRQRWERWNFALQRVWAGALFAAVRRIYSLSLEVEGDAEVGDGPLLVFVRHASLADTLLPCNLLSIRHGLRLRYVLKRELLFDPCLDIVGQRLPNVFVQRGSGDGKREIDSIRRLAADLGDDEGLLIYPEGTRFSPARRARALERIAATGETERLERARSLRCLLPPRTGGPQALLETRPDADVLIVGHVGLDGLTKLHDFADGSLVGRQLQVRFHRVPAAEIPGERPARIEWLDAEWARLDAWIQTKLESDAQSEEG
jgi:1-acyl-sn-glycerol-3-phosphate acyltransferase